MAYLGTSDPGYGYVVETLDYNRGNVWQPSYYFSTKSEAAAEARKIRGRARGRGGDPSGKVRVRKVSRRNPSKQKRMSAALKKYLKSLYPHKTLAGAKVQKNPGGSITIVPIHLRKRSR